MTYISDEVEVRSRIQNLKQRTDRTYRRHRQKPRVRMHNTTSGTAGGSGSGGQILATAGVAFVDNTTIAAVRADSVEGERGLASQLPVEHDQMEQEGVNIRGGNALRLPPIVLPPITTAVTANNTTPSSKLLHNNNPIQKKTTLKMISRRLLRRNFWNSKKRRNESSMSARCPVLWQRRIPGILLHTHSHVPASCLH